MPQVVVYSSSHNFSITSYFILWFLWSSVTQFIISFEASNLQQSIVLFLSFPFFKLYAVGISFILFLS